MKLSLAKTKGGLAVLNGKCGEGLGGDGIKGIAAPSSENVRGLL